VIWDRLGSIYYIIHSFREVNKKCPVMFWLLTFLIWKCFQLYALSSLNCIESLECLLISLSFDQINLVRAGESEVVQSYKNKGKNVILSIYWFEEELEQEEFSYSDSKSLSRKWLMM
jgi:hypothetical protein